MKDFQIATSDFLVKVCNSRERPIDLLTLVILKCL